MLQIIYNMFYIWKYIQKYVSADPSMTTRWARLSAAGATFVRKRPEDAEAVTLSGVAAPDPKKTKALR